jgi:hypothetical protein
MFENQATQKQAIINARVGQGQFRRDLLELWGHKCPLSGIDRDELLRASHIKPWASSNNCERLDPANGLLLAVSYDAAFDALLITFDDDGNLVLADDFPAAAAIAVGIAPNARLPSISGAMKKYIGAHRELMNARLRKAGSRSSSQVLETLPA